jgi:hypothetical protein
MRRLLVVLALLLAASGAEAQTCPVTQSTPALTAGGNVFGRIASQWNSYFGAKVDANNGSLCNPTINGQAAFPDLPNGELLGAFGGHLVPVTVGSHLVLTGSILSADPAAVYGPASAVLNEIATYADTTGKLIKGTGAAYLDAAGLNIGIGVAAQANVPGYAMEVQQKSIGLTGFSSTAAFFHNDFTGSDANANVNGSYSDLWYEGTTAGNQGFGSRNSAFTYTAGSPLGSLPHQYFNSPNIGTLTYLAGVYGRTAHYLPGTITYAASVLADGIYNISTPVGGAVSNFSNFLAIPPYAAASLNYAFLIPAATCSPNCYDITFRTLGDPLTFGTAGGAGLAVLDPGATIANYTAIYGAATGAGPTIRAQGTDPNPDITVGAKGTGSVILQSNSLNSATFSAPAGGVNNFSFLGSISGSSLSIGAAGSDTDIRIAVLPKGAGSFDVFSPANVYNNIASGITADGATLTAQSDATTAHYVYTCAIGTCNGTAPIYDAVRGVMNSLAGQGSDTFTNAVSGYVIERTGRSGPPYGSFPVSAAFNAIGICAADGCGVWGFNSILTDNEGQSVSSHGARFLFNEYDFNVTSPNTTVSALNIGGTWLSQPLAAFGPSILAPSGEVVISTNNTTASGNNTLHFASTTGVVDGRKIQTANVMAGTTVSSHTSTTVVMSANATGSGVASSQAVYFEPGFIWNWGWGTTDNCCLTAFHVGAAAAAGASVASQNVDMLWFDASGVQKTTTLAATATGLNLASSGSSGSLAINLLGAGTFRTGDGGGLSINGLAVASGSGTTLSLGSDAGWTTAIGVGNTVAPLNLHGTSVAVDNGLRTSTAIDKGAGSVNSLTYWADGTQGIASCSVVTAAATITIKAGLVVGMTGC